MKENNISKDCKVFTITLSEDWSNNILEEKYRIISEVRETENGFEYDIEYINNKKLLE